MVALVIPQKLIRKSERIDRLEKSNYHYRGVIYSSQPPASNSDPANLKSDFSIDNAMHPPPRHESLKTIGSFARVLTIDPTTQRHPCYYPLKRYHSAPLECEFYYCQRLPPVKVNSEPFHNWVIFDPLAT